MSRPLQSDGRLHGVVAAIRDEQGRFLLIRRAQGIWAAGKLCFPGGAVEAGESQPDALVREMKEELGVVVRPLRHVWTWRSVDPGDPQARPGWVYPIPLTLFGWTAQIISGSLTPNLAEIAEWLWLMPDAVLTHPDCLPTNANFIDAVLSDTQQLLTPPVDQQSSQGPQSK